MPKSSNNQMFRVIPAVDAILDGEPLAALRREHPRFPWTRAVRETLDHFRALESPPAELGSSPDRDAVTAWAQARVGARFDALRRGGLRRVINATGVALHTNLGRAVIGSDAVRAAQDAMAHYVNLEVDLESGDRSHRGETLIDLIRMATGADDAVVLNNNAAAVYIVANSCSPPGRVLVSRGELVEIGGSFRLPEILCHAAAEVVEVGTTNRTYAKDYEAVARPGDLILKVHKSNYAIEGFAHEPTIAELVDVAREKGAHFVFDLGSGAVFDYRAVGLGEDPAVSSIIGAGVDAVTMSGDKLLGGPQAGIVAGRSDFIEALRGNPLRRAFRVDKVTIAALQEVMRSYLFGSDAASRVPLLRMVQSDAKVLLDDARRITKNLKKSAPDGFVVEASDDVAAVGGGSLSGISVDSAAVVIECPDPDDAVSVARRLRRGEPPVFCRIKGAELRLNLSTVLADERDELIAAIETVFHSIAQ